MAEQVKIPKAMFDDMEEKIAEYQALKGVFKDSAAVLAGYDIKAVVTAPPSEWKAYSILEAVRNLARVATLYGLR